MAPFFGIIIPAVCDRVRYICMKSRRRRRGVWGIRRRDCFSTLPEKKLPRHFVNTLIDITEKNNWFFCSNGMGMDSQKKGGEEFYRRAKKNQRKTKVSATDGGRSPIDVFISSRDAFCVVYVRR